jgi:hypothetical protein
VTPERIKELREMAIDPRYEPFSQHLREAMREIERLRGVLSGLAEYAAGGMPMYAHVEAINEMAAAAKRALGAA